MGIDSPHGRPACTPNPDDDQPLAAPSRVVRTHYLTRVLASHSLIMSVRPVKNLFELCRLLPNYGVGFKLKRNSWKAEDCYWTLSKTAPSMDGRHGKAYNGMKLPDWHNAQYMHQILKANGCEDDFPLFKTIHAIGFEGAPPESIISCMEQKINMIE